MILNRSEHKNIDMGLRAKYFNILENQNQFVSVLTKAMIFMYLTRNRKKKDEIHCLKLIYLTLLDVI